MENRIVKFTESLNSCLCHIKDSWVILNKICSSVILQMFWRNQLSFFGLFNTVKHYHLKIWHNFVGGIMSDFELFIILFQYFGILRKTFNFFSKSFKIFSIFNYFLGAICLWGLSELLFAVFWLCSKRSSIKFFLKNRKLPWWSKTSLKVQVFSI